MCFNILAVAMCHSEPWCRICPTKRRLNRFYLRYKLLSDASASLSMTGLKKFNRILAITNKGLTRYRVYILTGISQNELYGWYKGTKTPSLISLVAVAKALDCSLDYLAGRDEI